MSKGDDDYEPGDEVSWHTHGTTTHGTKGKTAMHRPAALDPHGNRSQS